MFTIHLSVFTLNKANAARIVKWMQHIDFREMEEYYYGRKRYISKKMMLQIL